MPTDKSAAYKYVYCGYPFKIEYKFRIIPVLKKAKLYAESSNLQADITKHPFLSYLSEFLSKTQKIPRIFSSSKIPALSILCCLETPQSIENRMFFAEN